MSELICIDDLAADFPDLTIVMAHLGVPWQEERLPVAAHKADVYIDLSGRSPEYFRPLPVQYANPLLQDEVLFGPDYPAPRPERRLKDFDNLMIEEEVRRKVLAENARKPLKS